MTTITITADQSLIDGLAASDDFITFEEFAAEQAPAPEIELPDWALEMIEEANNFDYDAYLANHPHRDEIMASKAEARESRIWHEEHARKLAERCPRCAGAGRMARYAHVEGGDCFRCHGTGKR